MTDNRSSQGGEAAAQAGHGDVSASEVEKYVAGVDFPTDRDGLIQHVRDQNAPNEVLDLMDRFPDQEYATVADVAKAVGDAKG